MGFREHLEGICRRADRGLGSTVMGFDGIAVETFATDAARDASGGPVDLEALFVEYGSALQAMRRASDGAGQGAVDEVVVRATGVTAIFRVLNPDYFVALALAPGGNSGKARYVLRAAAPGLVRELEG